jgi:hypothetical protein
MRREITAVAATGASVLLLAAAGCGDKAATPAEHHLVYTRGNGLEPASVWIGDADGGHARRLTRGSRGVLSPDGRTVAVYRGRDGIYVVSSSGRNLRRLTPRNLRPQRWSRDGKTLVATVETERGVPELVAIDGDSGQVRTIASGSLYGFDFSPDGDRIAYARAPEATFEGICGDQFDLYAAKLDGSDAKRLTHDGLSAFPAWGPSRIAYSHFQPGTSTADCAAAGVWTVDADGSDPRPVIGRAPPEIVLSGFYGLQPLAWLDDERLLVGLRSDSGTEGAVVSTRTKKLRRLNAYADEASSDGRFSVGSGGDQEVDLAIVRVRDARQTFKRKNACCPDWNR